MRYYVFDNQMYKALYFQYFEIDLIVHKLIGVKDVFLWPNLRLDAM
jgi:hypothetical protein